jgi:MYXO-CTERM domain-containing protein
MQNAVDWSAEDLDLLDIRARGSSLRILNPLTKEQQSFWEGANYALALLALVGIGLLWHWRRRSERPMPLKPETPSAEGKDHLSKSLAES